MEWERERAPWSRTAPRAAASRPAKPVLQQDARSRNAPPRHQGGDCRRWKRTLRGAAMDRELSLTSIGNARNKRPSGERRHSTHGPIEPTVMTGGPAWLRQAQPEIAGIGAKLILGAERDRSDGPLRYLMVGLDWPTANPINHGSDHPGTVVPAGRETGCVSGATPSILFEGDLGSYP
jgi:hypothetical protein